MTKVLARIAGSGMIFAQSIIAKSLKLRPTKYRVQPDLSLKCPKLVPALYVISGSPGSSEKIGVYGTEEYLSIHV